MVLYTEEDLLIKLLVLLQNGKSLEEVEYCILDEFGRCMKQIINSAQSGIVYSVSTVTVSSVSSYCFVGFSYLTASEDGSRRQMIVH